jgi:hypothetical protein
MAEMQLRTLRVSAELDSSQYVAGARDIAAASQTTSAAVAGIGASVATSDAKISSSVSGFERLKRQFIDGHAAASDLEAKLKQVGAGVERGALTTNEAARAIEGIVRRYGTMADASTFAARGQTELASAVDRANAKLREQSTIRQPAFDFGALRAQQQGVNFSSDLNSRLGIGAQAGSARASAAVFEEAAREAEQFAQKATLLRAQLDPVGASQARLNAEISEYSLLLARAEISTSEFAQAQVMATARHDQFVASLNRTPANDNPALRDRDAGYRRQNLGYQLFDIGQSASLGMPLAMIAAQQGPQIAQLYAAQGGLNAAMKDFGVILGGVARIAGPFIALLAGVYGAYRLLTSYSAEAGLAVSETTRALAAQAAPIGSMQGAVAELAKIQKDYNEAVSLSASVQDSASRSIVASSQREFEAKKALLEIELKRQEASLALQQSEIAIASLQLKKAVGGSTTEQNLVTAGFSDPKIGRFINASPVDADGKTAVDKINEQIANNPAADKIKEINAQATLTQIAVEKLREGLKQVFDVGTGDPAPIFPNGIPIPSPRPLDGADEPASVAKTEKAYDQLVRASAARIASLRNEISLVGQATSVQARLRAEFEAEAQYREQVARAGGVVDEKEIAALKEKAAAVAQLTQQLSAANMLRDQGDQIQQLQLEAQLVGASAQQRAVATAALQAEQQMRQQGIELLSKEGQFYMANAQAMAQARLEIERQNAAYSSLEQAGGSAIDSLTVGTGSLKDRLKSAADTMLQWVQQMTIANPLKNAMFGSNLPTMADMFSGRPLVPGATSTGMMTVTAGTVMVNGGLTSGLVPGASPSALFNPANNNVANPGLMSVINPTNGVRPSLTAAGVVNSPVADPASRALMWRQGISQIESGSFAGNYNAIGPVTRSGDQAYGRYQVMGANIPSWTEKHYGQRLTPQQYLANQQAQDSVFDGEFGSYVSKYGEGPAATKWFTGSPVAKGRADVNGMTDNRYSAQFTSNMQKLSQTTATASKDIGTLGDTSTSVSSQITDGLGKLGAPAVTPAMPAVSPTAPTGGSNIFSSLFGGIFKLFGFADGTDYSPGGTFMVGERGRELVNLPRGSQVVPNHKLNHGAGGGGGGGGKMKVDVGVSVDNNGNLQAYVKNIAQQTSVETTGTGIAQYHSRFGDYVEEYRQNPYNRGAA